MNKKLKNVFVTIAFPAVTFVVMEVFCFAIKGHHVMASLLDLKTLIRDSGISAMIAFALSFNLSSGRYDLSLGAQRLAGTIIGGYIAVALGLSGVWFLIFALFFGLLFVY